MRKSHRRGLPRLTALILAVLAVLALSGCNLVFGGKEVRPSIYSPQVVYGSGDSLYMLAEGRPRLLHKATGRVSTVSISPNGRIAAALSSEGLVVVGAPSGKELAKIPFQTTSGLGEFLGGPAFSGNNQRIAFTIPGFIGGSAAPGGSRGALHVLAHQVALDGSPGGVPLPLPPSDNLEGILSLNEKGGRGAVLVTSTILERTPEMYLLDFEKNKINTVKGSLAPISAPVVDARGANAYVGAFPLVKKNGAVPLQPDLYRIDFKTRTPKRLTHLGHPAALRPLALSSDDSLLYSLSSEGSPTQLRLLDKGATRSAFVKRLQADEAFVQASISPDKRQIAYITCAKDEGREGRRNVLCSARVKDLRSGREETIGRFPQPSDTIGFLLPTLIGWLRPT